MDHGPKTTTTLHLAKQLHLVFFHFGHGTGQSGRLLERSGAQTENARQDLGDGVCEGRNQRPAGCFSDPVAPELLKS